MGRMTPEEKLARLMKRYRAENDLNTEAAGDRLGLSARTIEGIEQGRGFNSPRVLELALERLMSLTKA
jgi:DNA-binding XRE family transcriptional regulator